MAKTWTDAQKQAIDARQGSVLVSAAAGSGKTAVLVERVIKQITDTENPVDVERLLIVTFTIEAAKEMKERISKRLAELICEQPSNLAYLKRQKMYLSSAQISTMDSFCNKLVKENFERAEISPDFKMLSDIEHDMLKREAIEQVLEEVYELPKDETDDFLKLFTDGRNDEFLVKSIYALYEFAMASYNPNLWVEKSFSDYFNSLKIHETKWGKYCLSRLYDIIAFTKNKADDIIADTPEGTKLYTAITDDLGGIQCELDKISDLIKNSPQCWDEIKERVDSLKLGKFARFGADEKDEYYDEIKGRRDSLKSFFSSAADVIGCTEEEFYEDMDYLKPIMRILKKCVVRFMEILGDKKKEQNVYYFSDILHFALKILVKINNDGTYEKTDIANELSQNYVEILIDEFQDTNMAQDTLFEVISDNGNNKFMVGDVKQSIYRFRQAMPEIFMDYKDSFKPFNGKDYPATISLDKNFRSRKGIVNGINFFFDFLMTKKLSGIDYKNGEQLSFGANYNNSESADVFVNVIETEKANGTDLSAEARQIGENINNMISSKMTVGKKGEERPVKYSDICILLRAAKGHANTVTRELTDMGIPVYYQKDGGFFESRETVTLLSMLKIIDNPVQDVPLVSVMLSPMFPFTEDDLAKYRCDNKWDSVYNMLKKQYNADGKVKDFLDLIGVLRTLSVTMSIDSLIRRILEVTSYDSIVGAMDNGEKRLLNIERLIGIAADYEKNGGSGLTGFIRYLERIRKNNDLDSANEITENDNVVRIMTIHGSKGLEFPVVFLANSASSPGGRDDSKVKVNRKLGIGTLRYFPKLRKNFDTLPFNAIKLMNKQEEAAEAVRLLYVAMTRAEEKLYIVGSMHNAEKKITELYQKYYVNFSEPDVPLSMCNSFLKWVLLAMMYHPSLNFSNLLNCCKNPQSPPIEFSICEKLEETSAEITETPQYDASKEILNTIKERLSFEYPYSAVLNIPAKYAASLMNREENLKYLASENPAFAGMNELTPAQRGTLTHKFMEICDFSNASKDLNAEIQRAVENNIFSQAEADALNKKKISGFFNSDLYKRISSAKMYAREKEFAMALPISFVAKDLPKEVQNEEIHVQGVIDGLIINGNSGEIVDFKTDRAENEEELCERYYDQMSIYKKAAEECFGLRNVSVTLYSFSLSKEISVKL